jgi:xylan 1,4-beta-xylosidase
VKLNLKGIPNGKRALELSEYRIDQDHSNAFTAWKKMGSPQQPTADQYAVLEKAGQLTSMGGSKEITSQDGSVELSISLPRQAVSLFILNWNRTAEKP